MYSLKHSFGGQIIKLEPLPPGGSSPFLAFQLTQEISFLQEILSVTYQAGEEDGATRSCISIDGI